MVLSEMAGFAGAVLAGTAYMPQIAHLVPRPLLGGYQPGRVRDLAGFVGAGHGPRVGDTLRGVHLPGSGANIGHRGDSVLLDGLRRLLLRIGPAGGPRDLGARPLIPG